MADTYIFRRVEKKYSMTLAQKDAFMEDIQHLLEPDKYGRSTVCSLYLDTPDHILIRNSIDAKGFDKPAYREKLRIRSYGTPKPDSKVFMEIKKKYKGVVYKRRIVTSFEQARHYLDTGQKPVESQIMEEIDYAMKYYRKPGPAMMICCEREAYSVKDMPHLRLTFDTRIRGRDWDLSLALGTEGVLFMPEDMVLMEVKTDGAMPLWLAHALDKHKLYPSSFSKYGTAYLRKLSQNLKKVPQLITE